MEKNAGVEDYKINVEFRKGIISYIGKINEGFIAHLAYYLAGVYDLSCDQTDDLYGKGVLACIECEKTKTQDLKQYICGKMFSETMKEVQNNKGLMPKIRGYEGEPIKRRIMASIQTDGDLLKYTLIIDGLRVLPKNKRESIVEALLNDEDGFCDAFGLDIIEALPGFEPDDMRRIIDDSIKKDCEQYFGITDTRAK